MSEPPSGWNPPGEPAGWTSPTSAAPPMQGYGPAYGGQPGWYGSSPQPGIVPLRPLGLGELLDGAIKILRKYPRPTLGLSAAIAAVVTVLNVLIVVARGTVEEVVATGSANDVTAQFGTSLSTSGPGTLVRFLGGLVLTGALIAVVGRAVLGQPASLGEIWVAVRPRLWALLGLSLLTLLIVFAPVLIAILVTVLLVAGTGGAGAVLGFFLVMTGLVGSAYLYTRFALAPAALVLEKATVTGSLRRSTVLIRGAWWRTFWILVLTSIIGAIITGILGVPIGIAGVALGHTGSVGFQVVTQVASGLATVIVSPFTSGVRALLYVDRRMRAEGLDVSLAAAAAGAPPA